MPDNFQQAETNEKSHTQKFWRRLIFDVFRIVNQDDYIEFEKRVLVGRPKFIDAYIPSTGIVIEQKSPGIDLSLPERQSDGSYLTPYEQAKRYYDWLPVSQKGRYILTCNFHEIHIHDMEAPSAPPVIISRDKVSPGNLGFLLTPGETLHRDVRISVEAGQHVRKLYDYLLDSLDRIAEENHYDKKQYDKARDEINVFCVRLVFLLYAEDSGLFRKSQFTDYFRKGANVAQSALKDLFTVLKTKIHERDPFLSADLKEFPYVNGGLFHDDVKFPQLDDKAKRIILHDMAGFDWSPINPTIFGAIFEATLNDETRKQEGIHYTSSANIHKLIDPLFLDGLTETLSTILDEPESPERTQKLLAFQEKLSALRFLDPACGSGNFLTESFTSLRRLENSILDALPVTEKRAVKVEITQFHGIEAINFAVNIAKTALWISDHQMWKETQEITHSNDSPLPLKEYDGIEEGDALKSEALITGWNVHHEDMLYIMGNPPFVGRAKQTQPQQKIVRKTFGNGKIDYVSCWFAVASEYVRDKNVKAAFVATNSIVQGEQVGYIFKYLCGRWHIKIDFAYPSFVWKNELPDKSKMAHVHVVIIGFSTNPPEKRRLYYDYTDENGEIHTAYREVDNINFYLHEGPDEDIAFRTDTPICANAPAMTAGNMAADGGNLIIEAEDYAEFIKREPEAAKYIKRYMMGDEFIKNKPRWCLWLVGATPDEIKNMPLVYKRVKACRELRQKSSQPRLADTPHLFREQMNPAQYVAIPQLSSESRKYIPMGFLDDSVIPGAGGLMIIPGATLYHFGVLTSRIHMAWMRRVCGRLEMRYRYSGEMVYNTFPWPVALPPSAYAPSCKGYPPSATLLPPLTGGTKGGEIHALITETAQGILDARRLYPNTSFAGLYDDSLMPIELRRAHERNDRAVCRAYGWDEDISEGDIVRELFGLYHMLTRK